MPTTCDGPHAWKMCRNDFFPDEGVTVDLDAKTSKKKNREREKTLETARQRRSASSSRNANNELFANHSEKTKRNRESERPKSDDDERYPTCIFKNTINIVSQLISYPIVKVVRPNHINLTPKRKKRHARVAFRLVFSSPRSRLDDDDF